MMRSINHQTRILIFLIALCLLTILPSILRAQSLDDSTEKMFYKAIRREVADSILVYGKRIDSLGRLTSKPIDMLRAQYLQALHSFITGREQTADSLTKQLDQLFKSQSRFNETIEHGAYLMLRARLSFSNGKNVAGRALFDQALGIFRKHNELILMAGALGTLAIYEKSRGNYHAALECLLKANRLLAERGSNNEDYARNNVAIGVLYNEMGQFIEAKVFGRQALLLYRMLQPSRIAYALNVIGYAHLGQKNYDSAEFFFNEAFAYALKVNNPLLHFSCRYNNALLAGKRGDYQKSNRLLEEALSQTSNESRLAMIRPMSLQASNYLALGERDKSLALARYVFKEAKHFGLKEEVSAAANIMAQIFQTRKQLDSTAHYLRAIITYQDSTFNKENQNRLGEVFAEMANLHQQKEIELLKSQQETDRINRQLWTVVSIFSVVVLGAIIVILILRQRNNQKKQQLMTFELKDALQQKQNDLQQQTLRMIYVNNGMSEVVAGLRKLQENPATSSLEIQQMLRTIQLNKSLEKEWENFERFFSDVHTGFYDQLNKKYPLLTIMERRLAGLIKLNLTNAEIASILNIEPKSVRMAKYRLKRKMDLNEEHDLHLFLDQLASQSATSLSDFQ